MAGARAPPSTEPATQHDTTTNRLGTGVAADLTWEMDVLKTLENARKAERKQVDKIRTASPKRALHHQLEYLKSGSAKATAAYKAIRRDKKADEVVDADVQALAQSLQPFAPCTEPVKIIRVPKGLGEGYRKIQAPGPQRYALNRMARRCLEARFVPHPGQYAVRGKGRDRACADLARAIHQDERRYATVLDIKDAYGSAGTITGLPLPKAAYHLVSLCPYDEGELGVSSDGLPQGAAASDLALAMILQPMLDMMPPEVVSFLYVDDLVCLSGSADAAAATSEALMQALSVLPGGFTPKFLREVPLSEGFTYLGYFMWRDHSGEVQIRVSEKAIDSLGNKCRRKAAKGYSQEQIHDALISWRESYSLAKFEEDQIYYIDRLPSEAKLIVEQDPGFAS